MKRTIAVTAMVILVLALASPANARSYRTTTETRVSFSEIAEEALSACEGVELGSRGATVTMGVAGHEKPVHVDFEELARTAGEDTGYGALARLLLLPTVVAALSRALRVAAALSRRR